MRSEDYSIRILKALAHPIRFEIVKYLLDQPLCVCELKEHLAFSQPNLSQHLRVLKEAGIVDSEKVGTQIHYHIALPGIVDLVKIVEELGSEYLDQFKEVV
jgi:DNA-binding transcriptional ArsR family regulator